MDQRFLRGREDGNQTVARANKLVYSDGKLFENALNKRKSTGGGYEIMEMNVELAQKTQ